MSLDRIWSQFGESPNSLQTHSSCPKKSKQQKMKTYEFGKSLENLQTHSKLIPPFQIKTKVKQKKIKLMSLERVWRISKLTPNSFLFSKKKSKTEKTKK